MLKTSLAGVELQNPTVLASGIMGLTGASLCFSAKSGAAAVTMKSVSIKPREGHPNPTIVPLEHGMINAVGLSNPGSEEALGELGYAVKNAGVPVIASIFGSKVPEYATLAKLLAKAGPHLMEVNISCPNVEDEFGRPFSHSPELAAIVTKTVKKACKMPVLIKLSPNVSNIKEIAEAVEHAGADGITAINTVGPGMAIDINSATPILTNKCGGLSGPMIRPIAVRCVYDIYKTVKIPILGTGGVETGRDAIEMVMAGASAVGVGTAVHSRGIGVFKKVCAEMQEFMDAEGYKSIEDMRGVAHE